jgi:hypothetical protein
LTDEPRCPKHPDARAIVASGVATDSAFYICVVCGDKLERTDRRSEITDTMDVGPDDVARSS